MSCSCTACATCSTRCCFLTLGWLEVHGFWAMTSSRFLSSKSSITLLDFVEEDMSRKLPASERINHTLLALNYGAILMLLLPVLIEWAGQPTGAHAAFYGFWSILAAVAAVGAGCWRLSRSRGVETFCAIEQRARHRPRRRIAGTADHPGHRRDRFHRQPAGRRPHRRRPSRHRAGAQSRQGGVLRPPITLITSLDQLPADTRDRRHRQSWRASRSATGCGPTPSAARFSIPASA